MALKIKIDKTAFAALSDALKAEYIVDGEGYKLDSDAEDVGELRRAHARTKEELKAAKTAAAEAQALVDSGADDTARKAGDIVTLENSWKAKLDGEVSKRDATIAKHKAHIQTQLVDNVAHKLAAELSDSPALILPHIKARLTADFDGESPQTRVLDATGKPSAFTTDDLKKEFSTNKDFSAIIRVSKASGAGGKTTQDQSRAGGPSQYNDSQSKNPADMSGAELRDRIQARVEANRNQ